MTEEIWKLPPGTIPEKPGYHAVMQSRMLNDGKLNCYWTQVNNNLQAAANLERGGLSGLSQSGELHRRVRGVSDRDFGQRRPRAARGDVGREGRRLRQRGAPHPVLASARRTAGPGALRPVADDGVLEALQDGRSVAARSCSTRSPNIAGRRSIEVLFRNGQVDQFPASQIDPTYNNVEAKHFGFYVQKGLFEEYARFGRGHGHDLAPFDTYHQVRGLRWPVVNGKETLLALPRRHRPVRQARSRFPVLWQSGRQGEHLSRCPYEPAAESPDTEYPVVARHRPRSRALAFGVDDTAGAGTLPCVPERRRVHASRGCQGARRAPRLGSGARVTPRQDAHARGNARA